MAIRISGGISRRQIAELRRELKKRDLPPRKRQRLLWRIAKYGIIAASKRNQRQQQNPGGTPWEPRKRGNKKMLRGLPKLLAVREIPAREAVVVYLRSKGGKSISAGALGYIHARGGTMTARASGMTPQDQGGKMATRQQARALKELGYKIRNGKRWKRPSGIWIQKNISRAQAGVIIREMSGVAAKSTWKIVLPARAFLGASDAEFNQILARQLQGIDFGWNVNSQDIRGKSS